MTKGKPWDIEEIRMLQRLVEEGKSVDDICRVMVKSRDAVAQKMFDLKLKVVKEEKRRGSGKKTIFSSSQLSLPADLPNVEETLRILAAALLKSAEAGLSKDEVGRLQVVATLAKTYKDAFAEYLDYRGIEERLDALEAKYERLEKKGKDASAGASESQS
jgi:hypothetical protein